MGSPEPVTAVLSVLQALPGERVAPCAPGRLVRLPPGPGTAVRVLTLVT